MPRSSYQQIIEWNERRGDHPRLGMEIIAQIDELRAETDAVAEIASTYIEFVPIRLVTTLEVYLRGVIAELVDGNESFFERGKTLAKGVKIDLSFAAHVDRRELTVGDFVAHAVSLSRIESVVKVMETLLDNFTQKLKASHPRWSEEVVQWPLRPLVADHDAMMAALARLYEVRHVLTHELPSEPPLDPAELPHFFTAVREFIEATDWVVVEVLHGSVPRTQIAMNMSADDSLRQQQERLARTVGEIEMLSGIDVSALRTLQEVWSTFADAQATLVASQVEGGSMYPMIWAGEKAALVRERADQLARLKRDWMDP